MCASKQFLCLCGILVLVLVHSSQVHCEDKNGLDELHTQGNLAFSPDEENLINEVLATPKATEQSSQNQQLAGDASNAAFAVKLFRWFKMQDKDLQIFPSMKRKLMVLVRTGETTYERWEDETFVEFKKEGSTKPWTTVDPPLSEKGLAQVDKLRAAFEEVTGVFGEKISAFYRKTGNTFPICLDLIASAPDLSSIQTILAAAKRSLFVHQCTSEFQPRHHRRRPLFLLPQLRQTVDGPQTIGMGLDSLQKRLLDLGFPEDLVEAIDTYPADQQAEWWQHNTKNQILDFLSNYGNFAPFEVPALLDAREAFTYVLRAIFPGDFSDSEHLEKVKQWRDLALKNGGLDVVPVEHPYSVKTRVRAFINAFCAAPQVSSGLFVVHGDIMAEICGGTVDYGEALPLVVNCADGTIEQL